VTTKATSGRKRMTIDYPVRVLRQPDAAGGVPKGRAAIAARSFNPADDDDDGPLDDETLALVWALAELAREKDGFAARASWDPAKHPRIPAVAARAFNPAEPRDPHTGKWIAGMPGAVVETVLKVAGGALHVSAEPGAEGHATLSHGDRSVSLRPKEIEQLRKEIINAEYGEEDQVDGYGLYAIRRYSGKPGEPVKMEPLVALRPVPGKYVSETGKPVANPDAGPPDEEVYNAEFDLFIGRSPNDPNGDFGSETEPGVRVSLKDLDTHRRTGLYETLMDATSARRVDTGNGPTDVYTPRPGRLALRMKDDNGNPTEVEFNAGEWRRIDHAINLLAEGFDESKIPANAPDDYHPPEINHLIVQTAAGPVELNWRGPRQDHGYSSAASLTITPQYGAAWGIAVDGDHMSDLFGALAGVAEMSGIQQ